MFNNKNIAKQINSFLSTCREIYSQQGPTGKVFFYGLILILCCSLCSIPIGFLRSQNPSTIAPSPVLLPTQGIEATPTALFNFGSVTFTPFATLPPATSIATRTQAPSETPTSTPISPTVTMPSISTPTNLVPVTGGSVQIVAVDKSLEYVDIQNFSNELVDLSGWRLVSETGNQSCPLSGILQPNAGLRIWAGIDPPGGFSCGYRTNIWNNSRPDPAVLYDPQGQEISRFP